MSLEPLIKNFYNVEEVTRRWQKVHQDYGKDFLQEKIAREEIPAFISLQNCLLFPVSEVNKLYKYLELHITPTKRGKVYMEAIHESNEELIARRLASRKTFYASAWVFTDAQLKNTTFNKTSPGKYTKTFGNQDLSELFLNEKHLLSSEHSINHHYVESNCRTDIETVKSDDHESIIRVECPIAVTPFAQFDNPFGISFTPPEEIEALSKINLSNLGGELINKLSQASVVLWRGKFYYVVNKNTNSYKDQEYQCLSLSSDVLKSYQRAGGAVIRKKDIEKFEQSFFCQTSPSNHINKSSNIFEDLILFNQVIEDFKNSKVYDKYSAFLKHRNKGVTSADAFDIRDIDDWVMDKLNEPTINIGYNFTARSAELIKKMIVKKYSIKKDKRQISKITS